MVAIKALKEELEKLHLVATSQDLSRLDFLHALSAYIAYVKSEPLLQKLILSIREDNAHQSIVDIQKSTYDPAYQKILEFQEMADDAPDTFPLREYAELEEAAEIFSRLGSYKDEGDFGAKQIIIETKLKTGEDGYRTSHSGSNLLTMAEYVYPKSFTHLHTKLLEELDRAKKHGLFSKYLDYDPAKGILYFQGVEIKINSRKIPTNAHYLLTYLFAHNPFEKHCYDDMVAENALFEEKSWKSYYDACVKIKEKVQAATGVADFLDFSTGKSLYVAINSAYSLNQDD